EGGAGGVPAGPEVRQPVGDQPADDLEDLPPRAGEQPLRAARDVGRHGAQVPPAQGSRLQQETADGDLKSCTDQGATQVWPGLSLRSPGGAPQAGASKTQPRPHLQQALSLWRGPGY